MKKFTLIIASLFIAIGAMAQINYGKRTWTFPATSHEAVTEVPAEIFTDFAAQYSGTELTNEKVGVFVTDVRVATEGNVTATFVYNGGNIRMDIGGVDLVNANGEVVYSDYHFGFAGGQLVDNVYTLTGVAVGDYTMRVFIPAQKEDVTLATTNDSRGKLTIAGAWMYPNEDVYYNIKNVRSNNYATFKGVGKQFKTENANNGAGSYWHFVKANLDDVKAKNNAWLEDENIPAGYKPYYVYSAACEKAVENVGSGYMAAPDEQPYPAKLYYIGVQTNGDYTGLVIRPCNEDGSSWNDNTAGSVCHYSSGDAGSVWSIELANISNDGLIALGTDAKTAVLAAANAYRTAYYIYAAPSVIDAAVAEIEGTDISSVAKALTFVIEGTGTAIANKIAESATVIAPKAGDQFMIKACRDGYLNDYLKAAIGDDVKTTSGIGANDINALDLVWTLKTSTVEGKFNLYNERLGVYIAPLAHTMGYVTAATEAGVYSIVQNGANVLFHADGWGNDGYIHHPGWPNKKVTYWDNGISSQWQLIDAPIELTTNIEAPICYAIKSGRDGNYYYTLENNKIKLVNNADIVGNDNAKWFFMLDQDKNLKIYPYADKENTMGYITVADGNTKLTNDHNAEGFVADTYTLYYNTGNADNNNGKCFAFRPTEGNTFVSNHGGTGNYMGFYDENNDKGTRIGFECINNVVLTNKISAWEQYFANEGDNVCQYSIPEDAKNAIAAATSVAYSPASENSEYEAQIEALNALTFPTINLPEAGKYYRIAYNYNGTLKYAQALASGVQNKANAMLMSEEKGAASIFYFADAKLLSYTVGIYVKEEGNTRGLQANGAGEVGFEAGSAVGTIAVKAPNYMHANSQNNELYFIDHCGGAGHEAHNFIIEEVESLPVSITSAGYATLYAPVALEIADDVKAYTVAIVDGKYASMKEIKSGVIPANTGVILEGAEGTYDFVITTTTETVDTELAGTVAATYITEDAYVLGIVDKEVGLYTATKNQQEGTAWKNNSHKAYLPAPADANGIASYSFNFDWNGTTGIENIEDAVEENATKAIYDITGRKINSITVPGIYIINGKKTFVK